jgi:PAS domain S-box-containing protein
VAIASLIGCLGFAAVRLYQADHALRSMDTESYVWFLSQGQYEAVRFAEASLRAPRTAAPGERDELQERYDIMMSRLAYFMEGKPLRKMEAIGFDGPIREQYETLTRAEPLIRASLSEGQLAGLNVTAMGAARILRDAANKAVAIGRQEASETRQNYLQVLLESIGSVTGILFGAAVLSWLLLKGMRDSQRTQRLLRQEQEFSDLVISLSNQGVVIFDTRLRCLLWNPGMEVLLGVHSHEVVGRALEAADPLFRSADVTGVVQRAVRGESALIEHEDITAERERCLEISCHPLRMSERDLVIAFVRDVTERWQARRQAEQQSVDLRNQVRQRTVALHQAESRLIAAIKTAPDGFAAFDAEGKLLMANERIRSLDPVAGFYRDDMSLEAFLTCFAACEGADERLLTAGQPFSFIELDMQFRNDAWAHLSVTRDDSGTTFVRLTDITTYKHAALALQSALDREREMTSAYRSFVSMVSHQFRTPLAIVDSSAQRLMRQGALVPWEEVVARMTKIRAATSRLTRLVDGVLNAAKMDSGQIELNASEFDLVQLVSDICERQRELDPEIDIVLIAPQAPIQASCDGMLIEQVVGNLLSNAVKYSGTASAVEVRIAKEDDLVTCSVRDWGIGIPQDELAKVFDRFFRARTADGIAGTGIGLNVARQIIQMHGGDIRVESREGEGSIFTFTMPSASAVKAPQAA